MGGQYNQREEHKNNNLYNDYGDLDNVSKVSVLTPKTVASAKVSNFVIKIYIHIIQNFISQIKTFSINSPREAKEVVHSLLTAE